MQEAPSTSQPADVRSRRATILRRIAGLCFDRGTGALPAPDSLRFIDTGGIHMHFDTAEEVEEWAARLGLRADVRTYKPDWNDTPVRQVNASAFDRAEFGGYVSISGWTAVES